VSATTGQGLAELRAAVFDFLEVIRVYAKMPGKKADMDVPFVLPRGSTVIDFATKVHRDIAERLKFARLWGQGAFEGQSVKRDHALHDGDVLELHE
jgi:ribosome-interacting GTPase 1